MTVVSNSDLAGVEGELLPARSALSLIGINFINATNTTYDFPGQSAQGAQGVSGGDYGQSVAYACQATSQQGSGGLLGSLGLGTGPWSNLTCMPAAVTSGG